MSTELTSLQSEIEWKKTRLNMASVEHQKALDELRSYKDSYRDEYYFQRQAAQRKIDRHWAEIDRLDRELTQLYQKESRLRNLTR